MRLNQQATSAHTKINPAVGVGLALSIALGSGTAAAFCRTTTCDVESPPPECAENATNADGCSTLGKPLQWPKRCSWFGVQKNGSPKLGISYDAFHDAVKQAFAKWASVDCGGGQHPSFAMADTDELYGPAVCDTPEFNADQANASVWMFRDSSWSHGPTAIALTQLSADLSTGKIYDADVELNSFEVNITTADAIGQANLEAIVTHEAGHFLGLAHSLDPDSTMLANYTPIVRDLSPDDVAGICAVYPPSEGAPVCDEPEPLYGFSRFCGGVSPSTTPETGLGVSGAGCSIVPVQRKSPFWPVLVAFVALFVRRRGVFPLIRDGLGRTKGGARKRPGRRPRRTSAGCR